MAKLLSLTSGLLMANTIARTVADNWADTLSKLMAWTNLHASSLAIVTHTGAICTVNWRQLLLTRTSMAGLGISILDVALVLL